MNKSDSIVKISAALVRAQKKIGSAVKGSANPFFKSRYADLGAVMEACKEALNEEGVAVLQPLGFDEKGDYVETILLHESGEFLSEKTRMLPAKNMQELGSASTYARRFGLQSMGFIPAEDDDGNAASGRTTAPQKAPEAPKQAPKATPSVAAASPATPVNLVASTPVAKPSSFKAPAAPKAEAAPAKGNLDW